MYRTDSGEDCISIRDRRVPYVLLHSHRWPGVTFEQLVLLQADERLHAQVDDCEFEGNKTAGLWRMETEPIRGDSDLDHETNRSVGLHENKEQTLAGATNNEIAHKGHVRTQAGGRDGGKEEAPKSPEGKNDGDIGKTPGSVIQTPRQGGTMVCNRGEDGNATAAAESAPIKTSEGVVTPDQTSEGRQIQALSFTPSPRKSSPCRPSWVGAETIVLRHFKSFVCSSACPRMPKMPRLLF